MLNVILIIAFIGAIAVSIIFAGVTFLQGVQASLDAQIIHQRLLDVATQIQSHGRIVGAYFALPQGANGSSPYAYNQVPSWITGNAVGANGVPFEYCPYASTNNGGTAGTVTMGDSSTTYNVKYTNNAGTISQNYVTDNNGTTTPFTGAIGLLVAAAPNRYYPPNCSSVTSSNGYPIVSGGIAVSIQNDYLNKTQVPTAMTDMKFFVSTAATGDGSGRDASNYATFSNVLTTIQNLVPASAIIYLNPGSYSLTTTNGTTFAYGTRILLTANSGTPTITTSSDLTINEYSSLALYGVTLSVNSGTGTLTVNGTLEMNGAASTTATNINIYGGRILNGSNTMTLSATNVTIDGGGKIVGQTIAINNLVNRSFKITNGLFVASGTLNFGVASANIVPIFIGAGGVYNIGTTSSVINSANTSAIAGGIIVDPGGTILTGYLQINQPTNYGIYLHGTMVAIIPYGMSLTYHGNAAGGQASGIVLASGARVLIDQGSGGTGTWGGASSNDPVTEIDDRGGSIFTSAAGISNIVNIYAATNCWTCATGMSTCNAPHNVSLFMDSPTGVTTGNITRTNNVINWLRLYNNSNTLTCNIS